VDTFGLGAVQGDILYASASDTFARLAKSATATRYLANTGATNNPQWDQINLANGVTGTLPIANGGTGETSRQAAMDALAGAVTSGQYLRGNGTDVVMSAIQAADVPTLNQNTTGSAGSVTGDATGSTFGFNSGYGSVATAYGCRAWVNFNGIANSNLSGTYSRTSPSTTVFVTATSHGLITGNRVFLDFTTGTAVDGDYEVTVTGVNTFTVTTVASTTTSGNVTLVRNTIRGSGNISSISDNGVGDYTLNFAVALPDGNYCATFGEVTLNDQGGPRVIGVRGTSNWEAITTMTTTALRVLCRSSANLDMVYFGVAIFR
jgi:hypothetical protein